MKHHINFLTFMACLATAFPTAEPANVTPVLSSSFSFVDWVDNIASNPDAALTVDEAISAFSASASSNLKGSRDVISARQTFANCQQLKPFPAQVSDAVWCINDIARRGRAGQNCNTSGYDIRQMCTLGTARIYVVRGRENAPLSVNCNDIARTAGLIMDRCTRGDGTVSGVAYIPQGGVAVHIQTP